MRPIPRSTGVGPIVSVLRTINRKLADLLEQLERDSLSAPQREAAEQELRRELARLDRATREWLEEVLPRKYLEASRAAARELVPLLGAAALVRALTIRDRATLGQLQAEMRASFALITRDVTQAVDNLIRRSSSSADAVSRVRDLFDRATGSTVVRVGGKTWKSETYAKTIVAYRSAQVAREATRNRYLDNGILLVRISSPGSDHSVCSEWEGRICSLVGDSPAYPSIEAAKSAGVFHAWCRHRFNPIAQEAE